MKERSVIEREIINLQNLRHDPLFESPHDKKEIDSVIHALKWVLKD